MAVTGSFLLHRSFWPWQMLQLFLLPLAALAAASIPATSPLLLWQGRTERDDALGRVSFDWLSVSATFRVTNSQTVWATLNSTFWASPPTGSAHQDLGPAHRDLQQAQFPKFGVFRTYIDGARVQSGLGGVVVQNGEKEYLIADGLDPMQNYTVALWYTTDAVFNSWPDLDLGKGCKQTVVSVRTDGAFAPPPPPRTKHLLIIGDSITAGNAMYKPCDNATKCDASQSYASRVCEAFSLNCTMLTASSKGLLHNCCDKLPVTVPELANRTFAQDNATLWDWGSGPAYDAILVHLGTNDGGQSPPAVFTARYLLLQQLAAHATQRSAPMFAAWGPNSALMAPWVEAAAQQAKAQGLSVTLLDFMAAELDGCGHPGILGHPHMARIAAPIMANVTGWAYNPALL